MEFEDYLKSKKIDPEKFKNGNENQYVEFKKLFESIHPNSFTQQKLFLINKIRRTYHYDEIASVVSSRSGVVGDANKELESSSKPKIQVKAKPKIVNKPRIESEQDQQKTKTLQKPKIQQKPKSQQRPVVKPKLQSKSTRENKDQSVSDSVAKRKPQVKPKIQPKPKSD